MPETEIKNRLEALLNIEGLTLQVVEHEDSLIVMLNRSEAAHLDYTTIVDQIVDEVELGGIPTRSIQFYSRVLGEHEPDWARTVSLGYQGTGNATVIVTSARSAPTVIEPSLGEPEAELNDDQPTRTEVIEDVGVSATTIEEEEFNLPKPNLKPSKPKRARPKTPVESESSFSAPTVEAPISQLMAEDSSAATEIAMAAPKPKPKAPEPIVAPVSPPFPWHKLVLGMIIIGGLITIGWLIWGKTRPKSKPKPKKAQAAIVMPARDNYSNLSLKP